MKLTSVVSAMAFAVLAVASTAALAEKGTGFYLGTGVGYAGHGTNCEGAEGCSKSRVGVKLLAGYQIMPNLAIETSYGDTGRTGGEFGDYHLWSKTRSFTIAALGIYPVTKEVELFGKIGAHSTKNKIDINVPTLIASGTVNNKGLLAGAGAQYRFTDNLIGRVEYEYLQRAVYDLHGRNNINLVTASVLYQF